ncbi:MAG: hypothetical protein E4H27_02540 [Anaerolineales bacterium]|nr:MAG: hypothetical protein E4H27_02540 [Anaerolineales bacterium]
MDQPWTTALPYRLPITVNPGTIPRMDRIVNVKVDLNQGLADLGEAGIGKLQVFQVVEVDGQGTILNEKVPFQFDIEDRNTAANESRDTLALYLPGLSPAEANRQYHVYFGVPGKDYCVPLSSSYVTLTDAVMHQGQESYKIVTPGATYIYHKFGAGFASMLDPENLDWISYHPWGGSDGKYRGIPNLVYPEGHFHPGNTGCHSQILHNGPLKVTIASESTDDLWACRWDITPCYATLTVQKAPQPYWFLYEGTPGGALDEDGDFIVRSSGERTPASKSWDGAIPEPEWLYFGARNTNRVLYLVHHEHDEEIDSYWPMEHNMTVFGFGRMRLNKFMQLTPAHFTIGFVENNDFPAISRMIDSAYKPVEVTVGACQSRAV